MRTSVFALSILLTYTVNCQSISGRIINHSGQDPIIGANIWISELNRGTESDNMGRFNIDHLDQGSFEIKVSSVGFQTYVTRIDVSSILTTNLEIVLKESIYDLPQVVVESITMTGGKSGLSKVLGSAHYIDQKEIQKFSYTDINRTLRQIPGINVQEEDGYGLRPNIGMRATGSDRSSKITVMEDGVLMAPAPYSAPAAYYFPTIGRMESLEVMKGGSQVRYGPFTTGGAINLISTPIPSSFGGHVDVIAGTDRYRMLHANLGNVHKYVGYMVETVQYSSDGFKVLDSGGNTGFDKEDYLVKFRIHTGENAKLYQSVSLKVGQTRETSNETYLGLTDDDFDLTPFRRYSASQKDLMTTNHRQISLRHFADLTSSLDLHTVVYRNDFDRNWYKLDKVAGASISKVLSSPQVHSQQLDIIRGELNASDALEVKANNRSYYAKGIQSNLIYHKAAGLVRHKLDFSVRLHQDQIDRYQWVDSYNMDQGTMKLSKNGLPGTESNRIETAKAFSTYAQYQLSWEKWTVIPGLRHEDIDISRSDYGKSDPERRGSDLKERTNKVKKWIPGISLSYEYKPHHRIFGGIHKGFAPPGSKENTLPEESWNHELGWRSESDKYGAQVTGYYNDYSNLLGSDLAASGGAGSQDLFNGGAATAAGIEIEARYKLSLGGACHIKVPFTLTYTYAEATFDNDFESEFDAWGNVEQGDILPYVPRHQLGFTISAESKKLFFDVSAKYHSPMLTEAGKYDDPATGRTDPAFSMDIALNYHLASRISAFVNINNITDNIYIVSRRPAGVRPNLPRLVKFGLKSNF